MKIYVWNIENLVLQLYLEMGIVCALLHSLSANPSILLLSPSISLSSRKIIIIPIILDSINVNSSQNWDILMICTSRG